MRVAIVLVLVLTIAICYVECKKTAKRKATKDPSVTQRPKTTKEYETKETTKKPRKKGGKGVKTTKDGKSPKGGKSAKGGKSTKTETCHVMTDEYECKKQYYPCKENPCLNEGTCEQVKYKSKGKSKSKGMKGVAKCICPEGYYGATCNKIKCAANCVKMGCEQPWTCNNCLFGYKEHEGACQPVCAVQHCKMCEGPGSDMCNTCHEGFTLSNDKKHCIRDCPEGTGVEGTNLYQHGDNCYEVYEQNATYAEAQSICEALGTGYHLTSVRDCEEHQFLDSVLTNRGIPYWWIGLDRPNSEAGFTMWDDGSYVTYTYWVLGGPADKNCVAIDHYKGYRFVTEDCDFAFSFVCKHGLPMEQAPTGY